MSTNISLKKMVQADMACVMQVLMNHESSSVAETLEFMQGIKGKLSGIGQLAFDKAVTRIYNELRGAVQKLIGSYTDNQIKLVFKAVTATLKDELPPEASSPEEALCFAAGVVVAVMVLKAVEAAYAEAYADAETQTGADGSVPSRTYISWEEFDKRISDAEKS